MTPLISAQQPSPAVWPVAVSRWYACYTRARHEKQVDRLLLERGVESYLPLVSRVHQWKDRKKEVASALFPSYVFARVRVEDLYGVLTVPGVVAVVRSNGQPVVVSEEEIANVRQFVQALSRVGNGAEEKLVTLPRKGERVRIVSGPFAGVSGLVADVRKRCRVLIGLTAIGWGVQVELDAAAIEVIR